MHHQWCHQCTQKDEEVCANAPYAVQSAPLVHREACMFQFWAVRVCTVRRPDSCRLRFWFRTSYSELRVQDFLRHSSSGRRVLENPAAEFAFTTASTRSSSQRLYKVNFPNLGRTHRERLFELFWKLQTLPRRPLHLKIRSSQTHTQWWKGKNSSIFFFSILAFSFKMEELRATCSTASSTS